MPSRALTTWKRWQGSMWDWPGRWAIYDECRKKCRKIKSGGILFSPDATVWIRRYQIYCSILWATTEKFTTNAISNVWPDNVEYGTLLTCLWKRWMHGCRSVRINVNISNDMNTDTGGNICRIGWSMHGKKIMKQWRNPYWLSSIKSAIELGGNLWMLPWNFKVEHEDGGMWEYMG